MNIDINQLQTEVLTQTKLQRLYEIQIDISRLIANAHRAAQMAQTQFEQSEEKGNIGVLTSIREVLLSRIYELKEKYAEEKNERQRIDYNFRQSCKTVLKPETYRKILNLAMKTRKEASAIEKTLINKYE